ncbi:MAG: hypothetical protein IMF12_09975, partial [Proteobacteria bacterium]|nr:hypothetical protein [Pseudomonadota bacterium]
MKFGIRWRLISIMLSLIIAVLCTLTYVQIWSQQHILEKELASRELLLRENNLQRGQTVSNNFANQVSIKIAAFNFSAVNELVRIVKKNNEDLIYVILMNMEREAYIHTLKPELELEFLNEAEDLFALKQSSPSTQQSKIDGDEVIEFIRPIQV